MEKFNVVSHFLEASRLYPQKTALIEGKDNVSFSELENMVKRTISAFHAQGLRKGDRVLVFVPMGIDLYRVVLALFRMGAVAVFVDDWASIERLRAACANADCKAFIGITKARLLSFVLPELRKIPLRLDLRGWEKWPPANTGVETNKDEPALITFTTGSSGIPKAAIRTHALLNEQFLALKHLVDPGPADIVVTTLPIVLLINLGAGCTSLIVPSSAKKPWRFDPSKVCALIQQLGATRFISSPYFVLRIAEHVRRQNLKLLSLKQVFTGGAPVFPDDAQAINGAFPSAEVNVVYGSTEAEPISHINARTLAANRSVVKGLDVGVPHSSSDVRIIPVCDIPIGPFETVSQMPVAADGEVGEIIVAGPHVLSVYLNNEQGFLRNKIRVGKTIFHRTGDSGYLAKGRLYLTGPCRSVFVSKDISIYPFLYEGLFRSWPGIVLGTVIKTGRLVYIVFEAQPGCDQELIKKRCDQLPFHADRVVFIKKMPRDPRHFSKIEYEKLRTLMSQHPA